MINESVSGEKYKNETLKSYLPDYLTLFSISITIILLDQWTKGIIRSSLRLGQVWIPAESLEPYMRIVHWKNTGAAFGMFQNGSLVFTVLAFVVALIIINYYIEIPRYEKMLRLALAFQLGGAVGNLIDRLTVGWVTDFISIGRFPVFNVADASISMGVVFILLPFFYQFKSEYADWKLSRQSQEINRRKRKVKVTRLNENEDEMITLGLIGVILQDVPEIQRIRLQQRAEKIRLRKLRRKQKHFQRVNRAPKRR